MNRSFMIECVLSVEQTTAWVFGTPTRRMRAPPSTPPSLHPWQSTSFSEAPPPAVAATHVTAAHYFLSPRGSGNGVQAQPGHRKTPDAAIRACAEGSRHHQGALRIPWGRGAPPRGTTCAPRGARQSGGRGRVAQAAIPQPAWVAEAVLSVCAPLPTDF